MFVFLPQTSLPNSHQEQARTLRDLDLWSLTTNDYDGKALEPTYTPHPFKGTEPVAEIENAKLYTGSCHCGNVTMALKTKGPLSDGDAYIQECNCSICMRVRLPPTSSLSSIQLPLIALPLS